jgi:hypothetical protein
LLCLLLLFYLIFFNSPSAAAARRRRRVAAPHRSGHPSPSPGHRPIPRRTACAMTPRALAVYACSAAGSLPPHCHAQLRRPAAAALHIFAGISTIDPPPSSAPPPGSRPRCSPRAAARPFTAAPPPPLERPPAPPPTFSTANSATAAPQVATRRPHHHLRQVSHPSPFFPAVDAPSPPASSVSIRYITRARRRRTRYGGATATHR